MPSRSEAEDLVRRLGGPPRPPLTSGTPPRLPSLVGSLASALIGTPVAVGFAYGMTTADGLVIIMPLLFFLVTGGVAAMGWHGVYTRPRMRKAWRRAWENGTAVVGQATEVMLLEGKEPMHSLHASYEVDGRPYTFHGLWKIEGRRSPIGGIKMGDSLVLLADPEAPADAMLFPADYPGVPVPDAAPRAVEGSAAPAPDAELSMPDVLAGLGIPLSGALTTPENALLGGLALANVHAAFQDLRDGRFAEAIALLGSMVGSGLDPRVACVALLMRGRAHFMLQDRARATVDVERAAAACPEHPLDQTLAFLDGTSRVAAPRPFYAPSLEGATEVRRSAVDGAHEGILRRHPPVEQQAGKVQYLYTLAVHPKAGGSAVLYVASEYNKMHQPGAADGRGSHFLGVFPGEGHENLGASDDWADLEKFEARACAVARERLARG